MIFMIDTLREKLIKITQLSHETPLEHIARADDLVIRLACYSFPDAVSRTAQHLEWGHHLLFRLKEEDFKVYKDKFLCNLKDDGTVDPCKTVATMKAFLQILSVDWAVPKVGSRPRNPAGGILTMPASWGERDKNEVFVRQLPWNISEEVLKAVMENFGPTTRISLGTRSDGKPSGLAWVTFKSSEAAAKAIRCKNLAFPRASGENVPVVMIKSETCGTQPKQGAANQALGFVFLPINNIDAYALSVSIEDSITLNLDSAASGSLGNHPAFAQTPCTPTTWSGIDGGRIAGSGSEGSISGTSEVPVVYTTPLIEHTLQATHNLLSVNDVLTKNKFSVLFDHSDMSASIGFFPADRLQQVVAKAADGLDLVLSDKTNNSEAACNCEACVLAKMYRLPHPRSLGVGYWPDSLLEVVTADLMVFSHNNKSLGGISCYLTLTVRNALGYCFGFGVDSKTKAAKLYQWSKQWLERTTGQKLKSWSLDKGGENYPTWFLEACRESGVSYVNTGTEQPQSLGMEEGYHRIAMDRHRALTIQANALTNLWVDGLNHQAEIYNSFLHKEDTITPHEALFGSKPTVCDLKALFCVVYAYKLPKNCTEGKSSYQILTVDNDPYSVVVSSDVAFIEDQFDPRNVNPLHNTVKTLSWDNFCQEDGAPHEQEAISSNLKKRRNWGLLRNDPESQSLTFEHHFNPQQMLREEKVINSESPLPVPVSPESKYHMAFGSECGENEGPVTPFNKLFTDEEQDFKTESEGSAAPTPRPEPRAMRSCTGPLPAWSHTLGNNRFSDGDAEALMSISDGVASCPATLLTEDGNWDSKIEIDKLKFLEVVGNRYGLALSMLNGPRISEGLKDPKWKEAINKELNQFWGLKKDDTTGKTKYKARLVMDGRRQVAGEDYDKTHASTPYMHSLKLWTVEVVEHDFAWAADWEIWAELDELISELGTKHFKMTVKSQVDQFISIVFGFKDGQGTLNQHAYLVNILDEFLENPLGRRSPPYRSVNDKEFDAAHEPSSDDLRFMKECNYFRLVGKLQFLTVTRPVIQYVVGKLARHMTKTRIIHWKAAQELLEYLNNTCDHGLCFNCTGHKLVVEGYSDSDFAGDAETWRSTTGVLVHIGKAAVLSFSKRQPVVADSTVSAEVIAACSLVKEVIWVRNMLDWLGHVQELLSQVWTDNKAAVFKMEEEALRHKTKHLDIKYMFLRDQVRQGLITVGHCPNPLMWADVLTKGVGSTKFMDCQHAFGNGSS
ncbi:DNA-directed DNA polymerase [Chytriomyces confervae]|uniref:DNA-directed DNA polymerase n=1 Tax=Chytriomyces confervae TaxID=246404 RepID=A0A507FPJ2_9FUNG|nr:DNA-directed DNA polymerase [Chytriomyces confervae]